MFGQIAARGNRTPVSLLQTAGFYLFMVMLPVAERRRPHPSGTEKRGCGQSVMSKKALEERRARPSGALTSAALIDRLCVGEKKKELEWNSTTPPGMLNRSGMSLGWVLSGNSANGSVYHRNNLGEKKGESQAGKNQWESEPAGQATPRGGGRGKGVITLKMCSAKVEEEKKNVRCVSAHANGRISAVRGPSGSQNDFDSVVSESLFIISNNHL